MGLDQRFDPIWDFRRKDSEMDSSSNDSRINSMAVPKHKKQKMFPCNDSQDNKESSQRPAEEDMTRRRPPKHKTKAKKSKICFNHYDSTAAFCSLQTHIGSLVEEIKVAKQGLFSWMGEEMGKLSAEGASSKSPRRKKSGGQERKQQRQSETGQKLSMSMQNENSRRGKKKISDDNTGETVQKQASPVDALGSMASTSTALETTPSIATTRTLAKKRVAKSSDKALGSFVSTSTALAATPQATTPVAITQALQEKERVDMTSRISFTEPMSFTNQSRTESSLNNLSSPTIPPSTTSNIKPLADNPQKSKLNAAPFVKGVGNETISSTRTDPSTRQAYFGGLLQADRFLAEKGTRNACGFEQLKYIPPGRNESGVPAQFFRGLSSGVGMLNSNHLGFDHLAQRNDVPSIRINGAGMRFFSGDYDFTGHRTLQ